MTTDETIVRTRPSTRNTAHVLHRTLAELEAGLDHIRASPIGSGRLEMIVRRPGFGEREVLDVGELDLATGLIGDTWNVRPSRRTIDGSPHPDMQLNVMNARVVDVVASSRQRWALAGDQLFLDLHLGVDELPVGTRLAIGDDAIIEVTAQPHTGCAKFVTRFGKDAMRFVNSAEAKAMRLRGANARVVSPGTIRTGDPVVVVHG